MKKKLVIHVIPSLEVGGAQKLLFDIIENIDKTIYEVKVITIFKRHWSNFVNIAEKHNVEIISLSDNLNKFNKGKIILQAISVFRKLKPDIVHTHLNSIIYVLPAVFFSRVERRIHTFHSMADRSQIGFYGLALNIALKYMHFIPVGVGHTVKRSISKTYGLDIENIRCIFNGINTYRFCQEKNRLMTNKTEVKLVNVGSIYNVKNPKLLIESIASAVHEYPEIRLTMVGDGDQREEMEQLAKNLGLTGRIKFVGNQDQVEIYLREADIYITASNVEGVPLSVLEAMATGLPIISTRAGGVIDIIEDGVNGILVEIGNKQELRDAILTLCRDKIIRNKMGEKSLELSLKYSIEETVRKYEEIYIGWE